MNNRMTLADVIKNPDQFTPCSYGAIAKTCRVELDKVGDGLPTLSFFWKPEVNLYTEKPEEAEKLEAAGFVLEKKSDGRTYWTGNALCKQEVRVTFCNFRRYGWSWTEDPEGKHGYAEGPTYANGKHFYSDDGHQLVRDSFIEAWTEMKVRRVIPVVFSRPEVFDAVTWLLDDALLHVTDYAFNRSTHAAWNEGRIPVVGL